ncbi:AAR179Cp [Eremothecium gossypii ATCC 10895]|uniref:AAR179Cp n=1 Tax=Eremothecium gossypii (strain ATCC 10895 / CBS 109.51 / FGSC 9923 / NRRL Y-1056) TaxID=284811 RepID=Q75E98_EREGS|nr:AAR179Cp [Eremothecium gossypii ATCC 10895]AAS50546.1 AAR179Cp [Eremothecium gossypii ATCC 10895]AEY94833.1 FAAR179Cp [Eremothecium gossypii FDAG1]
MFEKDEILPLDEARSQKIKEFLSLSLGLITESIEKKEYDSIARSVSVLNMQLGLTELEEILEDRIVDFYTEHRLLQDAMAIYEPAMIHALVDRVSKLREKYYDPDTQAVDPSSPDFDLINLLNMQSLIMMRRSRRLYEKIAGSYNRLIAVDLTLDDFETIVHRYRDGLMLLKSINLEMVYFVPYCKHFENITIFVKEFGTGLTNINEKYKSAYRFLVQARNYQRKIRRVSLDSLIDGMRKKCESMGNKRQGLA